MGRRTRTHRLIRGQRRASVTAWCRSKVFGRSKGGREGIENDDVDSSTRPWVEEERFASLCYWARLTG